MIAPLKIHELKELEVYMVETKGQVIISTSAGKRRLGPKYVLRAVKRQLEQDIQRFNQNQDILP